MKLKASITDSISIVNQIIYSCLFFINKKTVPPVPKHIHISRSFTKSQGGKKASKGKRMQPYCSDHAAQVKELQTKRKITYLPKSTLLAVPQQASSCCCPSLQYSDNLFSPKSSVVRQE